MRLLPSEPSPGDKITAELIRDLIRCIRERQILKGAGYSISSGPNGTVIKIDPPKNSKKIDKPLPFEVRWSPTQNNGAGGYKIYLPTEHLLSYGGTYVNTSDISGATPIPDANGDDTAWSVLDDIDTSADHVWLVVTIPDESAADAEDGEDGEEGSSGGSIEAEFASEEGQSVTGSTVVNICIAEVSYEEPEDEGGTPTVEIKQSVVGALNLGGKSDSVTPDDVSTEFIPEPEEGEEPIGQEGKLQIFDFNSTESDSPEGFVERLKADTETGDIKLQSGSNIMLLARRNGKMVYIPLSADGKDPEDEKPYDPENPDPCAHPGDNAPGGATSESIDGGGAGGVDGGAGGVPASGDIHTGDDDCNCERV